MYSYSQVYEGLPFTLVETQCNGLKAVSSDAVTEQVKVSECIEFLSLEDSDEIWAETAIRAAQNGHDTVSYTHLTLPTICSV